jgi:hypothetical protein
MKRNHWFAYTIAVLAVCGIIAMIVLIPQITRHYDSAMLGNIFLEEKGAGVEGYKYNLSMDEKLYLLSNALNNRILPQSDYFAAIRLQESIYNTQTQSYAFQPVNKDSEFNSSTRNSALNALKAELALLSEKGILPKIDFDPTAELYEATLFSAIDILEPKKNLTVWQIDFSGAIINEGLVECIIDAQNHKLYSVSLRAAERWDYYDADEVIRLWAKYLGISAPEPYMPSNTLAEDATYYQKYAINTVEGDKTIVTVGYYEGIQEFFIKITR